MPIRPPALDDRRFDDLVAELLGRIPAHAPEWTNPQVGDPGRSLIELFAWLGDALLYRANLIPERQRLAFLRLLGQPLRPAQPATGLVTFALKEKKAPKTYALQARVSIPGPPPFESKGEITVLPLTAQVYYKRSVARETLAQGLEQALAEIHKLSGTLNPYGTTPLFADGGPEPGGFDLITQTVDQCLWLALLAPTPQPSTTQADNNQATLAALVQDGGSPTLNIGFVPALPSLDPLAPVSVRARIPHVWEITANTTGQEITADHRWVPEYLALDRVSDTTNGLTRPGVVRLKLPALKQIHAPTNDLLADPNAGVGDRPPRLDEDAFASRLVAWLRLRPQPAPPAALAPQTRFVQPPPAGVTLQGPEGLSAAPAPSNALEHLRLSWIGINAVEIEQLQTRTNQVCGASDGTADQELQLPLTSVQPETLSLQVEEETGWVRWDRVDDLSALDRDSNLARDARVYQLDSEAGTIRFGDGIRGRIPGAGRRVRFTQLRAGGGKAGNVPPGTLKKFSPGPNDAAGAADNLLLLQPLPLAGGDDAETLAEAEKRIPARLGHQERAVTATDYKNLAREAPGVSVGRTEILPLFKPQQRLFNVPGVVSVMVLPAMLLGAPPNPRADRPFLEAVHAWLDARRPLGTELYAIGCEYVPLGISVAIAVREDFEPDTTVQAVKDALRQVLWPLRGGGLQGEGWPLGGKVSNRELAVQVARVSGVDKVNALNLFTQVNHAWQPVGQANSPTEQLLELSPWQLPELLSVVALAGDNAPATLAGEAAPVPGNSAAVPVVPGIC